MDITKLDRRAMADVPRFLQFKAPSTGELMFSDDGETPIGAMVYGAHSRIVQRALRDYQRSVGEVGGAKSMEDMQDDLVRSAVTATASLHGVTINGAPITPDNFARFYDCEFFDADLMRGVPTARAGSYAQQVMIFINTEANFLPSA